MEVLWFERLRSSVLSLDSVVKGIGSQKTAVIHAKDRENQIVALKKSELYSSLWSSCDELRGSMDASQYKDYILVLLFIKYVSD